MRELCNGRWFTPLHPRVPFMQPHLQKSKIRNYCEQHCDQTPIAVEGQGIHVTANTTCKHIAGSEFLFIGDTRMRQHFLATIAYLRGVNLRGYANPSHPHFYGQQNEQHWYPPGRQESCGASMPHGFELECAGVVGGVATVCNGSVTLRLEETDDENKALKRLDHWMQTRKGCEESGTCIAGEIFIIFGVPIPKIRAFSSSNPVRPNVPITDVPKYLKNALAHVDTVWQASKLRGGWFYEGGGAASVARTNLIWALMEPFSLTEPRHAPHNRNITQLNAEVRQQLDIAGIPVLDGFRLCVDRFDCHPDNLHWCSSVQNAKVGILVTFARQLKEKLKHEEKQTRTSDEIAAQDARAQKVAQEILIIDEREDEKAEESEKKRKKAAEEARARKKQEEEEEARRKKEAVADKFAKFQKKGKKPAKFARSARMASPEDQEAGTCTKGADGGGGGTCSGPPPAVAEGGGTCGAGGDGTCSKPAGGAAGDDAGGMREEVLL